MQRLWKWIWLIVLVAVAAFGVIELTFGIGATQYSNQQDLTVSFQRIDIHLPLPTLWEIRPAIVSFGASVFCPRKAEGKQLVTFQALLPKPAVQLGWLTFEASGGHRNVMQKPSTG